MVTGCHARQESDPSETTGSLKQTAWIFFFSLYSCPCLNLNLAFAYGLFITMWVFSDSKDKGLYI